MSLIPTSHPARLVTGGSAAFMRIAAFVANVVAVIAMIYACNRLAGMSRAYFADGGGWEFLSYVRQNATNPEAVKALVPGIHLRMLWWTLAWITGVFAAGFGVLAVAGARAAYWRVHALLRWA